MTLEARDRGALEALQRDLRTLRLGDKDVLGRVVRGLRDLLQTEATAIYSLRTTDGAEHDLSLLTSDGLDESSWQDALRDLAAAPRPEPAVALCSRVGPHGLAHLRALISEGPSIPTWIGAFQPGPYDARQHELLAALVPDLRRRFDVEEQLEQGAMPALLDAVLDAIGGAAVVIDATGRVVEANAVARADLQADGLAMRNELLEAARRPAEHHPRWSATPVSTSAQGSEQLLVSRGPTAGVVAGRTALAARKWDLSARESEVLAGLAEGNANKAIARMLGVSERTIEVQVTALLSKAQVECRAELIVKLWMVD